MTFHTGQQASKCIANHEVPPAESTKAMPLSHDEMWPLNDIVLTLTLSNNI